MATKKKTPEKKPFRVVGITIGRDLRKAAQLAEDAMNELKTAGYSVSFNDRHTGFLILGQLEEKYTHPLLSLFGGQQPDSTTMPTRLHALMTALAERMDLRAEVAQEEVAKHLHVLLADTPHDALQELFSMAKMFTEGHSKECSDETCALSVTIRAIQAVLQEKLQLHVQ